MEDFCLAVYLSTQSEYAGVLNIASGKYIFDEDVVELVSCVANGKEYSFEDKTFEVIDINNAALILDFTPNINLEQGLLDFTNYEFNNYKAEREPKKNILKNSIKAIRERFNTRSTLSKFLIALFENLLEFALVVYLIEV